MTQLFEGLRSKDLKGFVEPTFTIDQYTSKMGEDKDVIVVGFRVNDKYPAIDLMEFIEKGYNFVLDADMSSGEEKDGKYQVFVEFERTDRFPKQLKNLLNGITQLTDCYDWRFRYHKDLKGHNFSEEAIMENVPLSDNAYKNKMLEIKSDVIENFFDQTPIDAIQIDESNIITIAKPYSGYIDMELLAMGSYNEIKDSLQGPIQLDEASQSQVNFLEKYLGNYEIHKINNKFLIKNGDMALIVRKDKW